MDCRVYRSRTVVDGTAENGRSGDGPFVALCNVLIAVRRWPETVVYHATEVPKGELGFFIISDGSSRPYRLKIRSPSFIHMGAFDYMARGYLISDIITIFGTYDIVMGECDR